jgi:ferric-dicitrate binding protein FerR (iron transport regulator)
VRLTDKEILELTELCSALADETLTDQQKARLERFLSTSEEARRFYVQATGLSSSLYSYAAEMQTGERDAAPARTNILRAWWVTGFLAAAAAAVAMMFRFNHPPQNNAPITAAVPLREFVAQLTGAKECVWVNGATSVQPGGQLQKGQRIELANGYAEITFDSGAQVVLQGPASLDVNSAWAATLNRGTIRASVPPEAMGFSISNPNVEIVDLGTEFTMSSDATGAAEVMVLKGEVEAEPGISGERQPIVLREKESRRFASSGISEISGDGRQLRNFAEPVALNHFVFATHYAHWSFDERDGLLIRADAFGLPLFNSDARLRNIAPTDAAEARTTGRWGSALHFNGRLYVKGSFAGISGTTPHSVVLWVKVPKDAKLSNAYAMVAWSVTNEKLGSHPVQIGWNRNPNEGTVGVLRTDYGGGFAVGATPLRDGQWHHIAVEFIPSQDGNQTMDVKQYVDGRFEGEGKSSPPGSDIFKTVDQQKMLSLKDSIWLGCRLGINGVRTERFFGEMDELFVTDRALEPREIVKLMNNDKLQVEIASGKNSNDPQE